MTHVEVTQFNGFKINGDELLLRGSSLNRQQQARYAGSK